MLEIKNISKRFENFNINNLSFKVNKGDYFVILGVSGAGKSLLLEIIAGLITPDYGKIMLEQKDITNEKIQKREIGLVFQDYAVFPHFSVFDNIAYSLRSQKHTANFIHKKVKKLASEMNISSLLSRKPDSLSGGEQQRVALARTLALNPKILLLDEPLASLDVQLRDELRGLLRKLNRNGQTVIHVTHQYEEAISLANKIAVLHHGSIIQEGEPRDVFLHPKTKFVANFTGVKNFFKVKIKPKNKKKCKEMVVNDNISIFVLSDEIEGEGTILIRSEDIIISEHQLVSTALNNFHGTIEAINPTTIGIELSVNIGILLSIKISRDSFEKLNLIENKKVWISFKASAVKFLKN